MSLIRKYSVSIHGHRTSFSLEEEFFAELNRMARDRNHSLAALVAEIDRSRARESNLSSALRLAVLADIRNKAATR